MKLIEQALAALASAEARFHELIDAPGQIAAHVKALAKASAEKLKDQEERLAAAEALLERVREVLEEVSGGGWSGLVPAAPAAPIAVAELAAPAVADEIVKDEDAVNVDAPPAVIPIPLSPELAELVEAAAPAAGDPSPG